MISVIIPYKNSGKWLKRCLDSLIERKGDFEFILVNDGSIDDGPALAEAYAIIDKRIRPFDNGHGPGVSGARNTGIDLARGEYITFLDADDELLPNSYETLTSVLGFSANVYQFNHLRYYTKIDKLTMKYTNEGGVFDLPKLPVHWFGVWNKLFSAEFLKDIRFDEDLQYGEDGLFILECLRKDGRIYHAGKNKTVVKHRFDNPNSLSRVKTLPDILKHINKYEALLLQPGSDKFKRTVCEELVKLWKQLATEYR